MHWKSFFSLAFVVTNVLAMLRFECSELVIQRFDPLLNPGIVSPHLHQIVGGNAFDITMDPANDLPTMSTCTTCTFDEDFSNYWTAVMYFKHANGTFKRVPQMAGQYLQGNGGMTVYYIQPYDGSKVVQFKKGFRMIVGDAMTRSFNSSSREARSLSFRCFNENFGGESGAPGTGTDTPDFPKKFCPGGIRSNIFFPTCWDGKNLDSPDHKSHVSYPNGAFESGAPCPASHPVKIPQVFLEIVWDTRGFKDIWPKDGSQPLVFSMGDPTGYGQHADYVFGWKGDALQKAMDQCTAAGGPCAPLTTQSTEAINRCMQSRRVDEPVDGWLKALPGCNSIKAGPGRATPDSDCGATTAYLPGGPGGPQSAPGGGSPAVSPPTTGGTPPSTGGGVTPPVTGGTPPATGGGGATVAHYGQCGGNGYTGATTCAAPYTCKKQNDWYSQCL